MTRLKLGIEHLASPAARERLEYTLLRPGRGEPDCVIRVDGASAPLGALKPGRIVRITYRRAAAGDASRGGTARVARTIEMLPKPASGAGQ